MIPLLDIDFQVQNCEFEDAWVPCGRFRGSDKVDIFDQAEIHEHLPDIVVAIELFLKKHASKGSRFGAMRCEDIWSIPLPILREAIVNAMVHSDYSQQGTPIRVAFFDNPIDIERPGMLLPGMTIEDDNSRLESRLESRLAARLMLLLNIKEAGKADLAKSLGHKTVSGELHKQIRRLMEQNLIEMTLPDTPTSRLQRYRLTPHGVTTLNQQKTLIR